MNNNDRTEIEPLSLKGGKPWKPEQRMEQDEKSSQNYTLPQIELIRNDIRELVFHLFLVWRTSRT